MHHRQRHGHDGVLRVPQRDGRRPRRRRPGDARAARRLRRVFTAVEMAAAANDDGDVDDVMMPSLARCQSERMPFQAASRAYVHTPHAPVQQEHAYERERDPFSASILPSIYRYCQKPDDLRSLVRGEERRHSKRPSAEDVCENDIVVGDGEGHPSTERGGRKGYTWVA